MTVGHGGWEAEGEYASAINSAAQPWCSAKQAGSQRRPSLRPHLTNTLSILRRLASLLQGMQPQKWRSSSFTMRACLPARCMHLGDVCVCVRVCVCV
jgi:hypothetical protein